MEKLRKKIDSLPKEHAPALYEVSMFTKKGGGLLSQNIFEHYRYIRASSEKRAKLMAILIDRSIFNYKKTIPLRVKSLTEIKKIEGGIL